MLRLPPLALYIHIPWCVKKCPYCDFNSHESAKPIPEQAYLSALIRDLNLDLGFAQGRKLSSIFIGGGTPSLISPSVIEGILNEAEKQLEFKDDIEITLEANPGTFEQDKFASFRKTGVNRLSVGIQSFHNPHLQSLGRIHDRASAITAASSAREAGFDNINLDLMHGLPEQSVQEALDDLEQAIKLKPEHISWYQLTIEPNTVFYKQTPALPVEDTLADIQEQGHALLTKAGYKQYEVSAYARKGYQSKHNINYWEFGDYLGIGAGAHGKVTLPDSDEIIRLAKTRLPEDYLAKNTEFTARHSKVQEHELPLEFLMNALRLVDGTPKAYFEERTGLPLSSLEPIWSKLLTAGLLSDNPKRLKTTNKGLTFLNVVLEKMSEIDPN